MKKDLQEEENEVTLYMNYYKASIKDSAALASSVICIININVLPNQISLQSLQRFLIVARTKLLLFLI